MFEFHGWATIRVDDRDDPDLEVMQNREEQAIMQLRSVIERVTDQFSSMFDLRRTSNDMIVLSVHGLRNHHYEPVIDLFRWLAVHLPFSYGLLYLFDDEDTRRGGDWSNEFRVFRLALGQLEEQADPFLSPYIPTVEPPWEEPSRD